MTGMGDDGARRHAGRESSGGVTLAQKPGICGVKIVCPGRPPCRHAAHRQRWMRFPGLNPGQDDGLNCVPLRESSNSSAGTSMRKFVRGEIDHGVKTLSSGDQRKQPSWWSTTLSSRGGGAQEHLQNGGSLGGEIAGEAGGTDAQPSPLQRDQPTSC